MQIIVNHVTRMSESRICVAGVERETLRDVRPTTPKTDPITRQLLRSEGGPFGPGAVVDLGRVTPEGQRPEVEDHRFVPANARHVEDLSDGPYLKLLEDIRQDGIEVAFGPDIREIRPTKLGVPAGRGLRSLAVVGVKTPKLYVDNWGKLYLDVNDGSTKAKLRVTDVRFYKSDQRIKADVVKNVAARLSGGVKAYVMVGLARAMWDKDGGDVHWLQCNGICLVDHAVGDVP
jgi:hypothetical protein